MHENERVCAAAHAEGLSVRGVVGFNCPRLYILVRLTA